ncbi:MAG: TIGR02281 family clan AA aspartic protease, partial [Pseudomonadota bacterium]
SAGTGENTGAKTETASDWLAEDHILERQPDGHFYVSANVEGTNVRMVVDTGASVVALTGRDASALGLDWDEADIRQIGQGASGAVYGVPANLSEIDIGGFAREDIEAVIIPRGLGVSLLGQSYLAQIDTVEISDDQMILRAE